MNPWDILWTLLGSILLLMVVIIAFVLLLALSVSAVKALSHLFVKKPKYAEPAEDQAHYLAKAGEANRRLYGDDLIFSNIKEDAFQAGAKWGWEFFHSK